MVTVLRDVTETRRWWEREDVQRETSRGNQDWWTGSSSPASSLDKQNNTTGGGEDNQYPEKRQLITLRLWAQRIIKYYLLSSVVSQLTLDLLLPSFTKVHLMVGSFELVVFYTLPTKSNSLSLSPTLLGW